MAAPEKVTVDKAYFNALLRRYGGSFQQASVHCLANASFAGQILYVYVCEALPISRFRGIDTSSPSILLRRSWNIRIRPLRLSQRSNTMAS